MSIAASHPPRAAMTSLPTVRFILSKLTSAVRDPIMQIHVVLNWAQELERRVPVK